MVAISVSGEGVRSWTVIVDFDVANGVTADQIVGLVQSIPYLDPEVLQTQGEGLLVRVRVRARNAVDADVYVSGVLAMAGARGWSFALEVSPLVDS